MPFMPPRGIFEGIKIADIKTFIKYRFLPPPPPYHKSKISFTTIYLVKSIAQKALIS
jgi:hypothetical protein